MCIHLSLCVYANHQYHCTKSSLNSSIWLTCVCVAVTIYNLCVKCHFNWFTVHWALQNGNRRFLFSRENIIIHFVIIFAIHIEIFDLFYVFIWWHNWHSHLYSIKMNVVEISLQKRVFSWSRVCYYGTAWIVVGNSMGVPVETYYTWRMRLAIECPMRWAISTPQILRAFAENLNPLFTEYMIFFFIHFSYKISYTRINSHELTNCLNWPFFYSYNETNPN